MRQLVGLGIRAFLLFTWFLAFGIGPSILAWLALNDYIPRSLFDHSWFIIPVIASGIATAALYGVALDQLSAHLLKE